MMGAPTRVMTASNGFKITSTMADTTSERICDKPAAQRLRQPLLEHADVGEETGEDVTLLALGVPGLRQRLHLDEHLAAQLAHHRRAHVGGEVGAA